MPVEVFRIPFRWCNSQFGNLGNIIFIVNAIAQYIPEISQRSFKCICGALLLGFLECCSFAFAIFDMAISDVLMIRTVS